MTHHRKEARMRGEKKKKNLTPVSGMSPSLEKVQTRKKDMRGRGGMHRAFHPHFLISEMC